MCALARAKDGRRKAKVHAGDTAARAAAVAAREQATSAADAQILDQAADEAQHLFIGEAAHKHASSSTVGGMAEKVRAMPKGFRPLPAALIWPNLEVMILVFFTAGIVESSAAILNGYRKGIMDDPFFISLAITCCVLILLFILHEGCRIRRFYKSHSTELWTPSPKLHHYSEVDDPLCVCSRVCASYGQGCASEVPTIRQRKTSQSRSALCVH